MHRQMTTTKTHYTTDNYAVVTQTGAQTEEINVINRNTGKVENYNPFETVEKAIKICDNKQRSYDKHIADLKAEQAAEEKAEAERKAAEAAAKARGPLATERQVDYIMSLLARTDGQNVSWFSPAPTEYAEVAKMTRKDASTYISALKGTY